MRKRRRRSIYIRQGRKERERGGEDKEGERERGELNGIGYRRSQHKYSPENWVKERTEEGRERRLKEGRKRKDMRISVSGQHEDYCIREGRERRVKEGRKGKCIRRP